jgi:hypothetical protein
MKTRYEKTIRTLQATLRKEQKRVRDLKSMYVKEMESKSELEKILRRCVDDIKEEVIQLRGEARVYSKSIDTFCIIRQGEQGGYVRPSRT